MLPPVSDLRYWPFLRVITNLFAAPKGDFGINFCNQQASASVTSINNKIGFDHTMTTKMLNLLTVTLCLSSLAAVAGPVNRADLPAEPVWAAHLDCDTLRPTEIGKYLLSEMEKPEVQAKLGAFQAVFNFDLRTQLHGLTLYSTGSAPENGILLLYADFDPDRLLTLAKAAHDYKCTTNNNHVIHNWIDDQKHVKNGAKPRVYASFVGKRALVFGQQESSVSAALDVIDGTAANLGSTKTFSTLGAAGTTSFLQASARKLNLSPSDPNTAIFRLSNEARLQIGDSQCQTTATLALDANDEDVAKNMASIAQGLLALVKLQGKAETTKLAEAISLKQDGATVTASLSLASTDIVDMMKADAARKAKKAESN